MVDITAKLIWYRLGETFDKMAEGGNRVTSWLFSDWDDNLLDVLLFGWIGWAVLVVLVVNAVLTFFGPLQPRVARWEKKEGVSGAPVQVETGAESTRWLNSGLNWFYLHYDSVPEFIELWVKSLNEQVVKLGGPVQLKFERVKPGSLPPKFNEITFEAGSDNKYLFHSKVDAKDLSFAIFASQQTSGGVKLTNLTANILKLKGTICFKCSKVGSDMILNISFIGRPDVKVQGKPVNPYQDPSDLVDIEVVEEVDPSDLVDIEVVEEVDPSDLVDIEVVEEVVFVVNRPFVLLLFLQDPSDLVDIEVVEEVDPSDLVDIEVVELPPFVLLFYRIHQTILSCYFYQDPSDLVDIEVVEEVDPSDLVDIEVVEEVVRNAICLVIFTGSIDFVDIEVVEEVDPSDLVDIEVEKKLCLVNAICLVILQDPSDLVDIEVEEVDPSDLVDIEEEVVRNAICLVILQDPSDLVDIEVVEEVDPSDLVDIEVVEEVVGLAICLVIFICQDPSDLVDIEVVEEVVRNAICLVIFTGSIRLVDIEVVEEDVTPFVLLFLQDPSDLVDIEVVEEVITLYSESPSPDTSSQPSSPRHAAEPVFESMEAKEQHSAFHAPPQQRVQRSMSGDKRLLVKIIKASGLGSKAQVDPTCLVYLDTPAQTYSTNECRGTANPFWDEQFLFDVNQNSSQLKFEVLDRRKPTTENFLGEAVVYYDELKRNPSSRQIISLQGRPERGNDIVSGSITVEFLVLDPLEAEAYNYSTPKNQISPKRTIEVTQAKSPSGMLVTKTTTTTQKHNNRHEPGLNSSPNYVEKRQNFDYDISGSSSLDRTSPDNMLPQDRSLSQSSEFVQIDGVDSVVETAIRELKSNKRKSRTPTKTTTLIITGVQRTPEQLDDDCIPTVITQPPSPGHHDRPDDMELGRQENPGTPNLKKSRSLGGSLKKLFRRSRKRSQGREDQEMSRESSLSRSSARNISKGPSRETSLTRTGQSSRESAIS
ncbi:unnamed protein product [Mytilus edulis]|uniref:C2 domain-containing protein n=1 Tax=Mytilus edulis TaxID=6550 RepID=A0A8S3V5B6_MYTED|nr:unnamed protein product [Mytilus edulis]